MKKETTKTNTIRIIAPAFYGNRTATEIKAEEIDSFILGYLSNSFPVQEPIDRTIVPIPGADGVVLIYNKYQEQERLLDIKRFYEREGYIAKPLAKIPEINLQIYSRCIVCRMNEAGEPESLRSEDCDVIMKYLAR